MYMTGVGGSNLGPECPCGEVNRCDGSPEDACNSDLEDGEVHKDAGWFIHKEYLPVSKVLHDLFCRDKIVVL